MAAPIQSYSKHSDNAMNHLSDYTYQRCCKCSLAKPVAATTICMHQAEPPYNNDLPEKITLTFQGNHCCTAARWCTAVCWQRKPERGAADSA